MNTESFYGAGQTYVNMFHKTQDKNPGWNPPRVIYPTMKRINDILQINDENVFDSKTVAKEVVINAFTIVSQVITTKRLIHENIR